MYNSIILSIIDKHGWKNTTPALLVAKWEQFAQLCIEGYPSDIYDYDNELSVRDKIDTLVQCSELKEYPEYNLFVDTVRKIDLKLKSVFQEKDFRDRENWWNRGILKYAGYQYCDDILSIHGVEVEERE